MNDTDEVVSLLVIAGARFIFWVLVMYVCVYIYCMCERGVGV